MPGKKGKSGRKRLPDHLKLVKGTLRNHRINRNQPKLAVNIPDVKNTLLSEKAQIQFERITAIVFKMGISNEAYVMKFELLAQALVDYYDAREELDTNGKVYGYTNGYGDQEVKLKPHWKIMTESRKVIIDLCSDFGMDAVNISKLHVSEDAGKKNKWAK
jgi:hypothetical protein